MIIYNLQCILMIMAVQLTNFIMHYSYNNLIVMHYNDHGGTADEHYNAL